MRRQFLKMKLKHHFKTNNKDPYDTILDLIEDGDGYKSIELAGKISYSYWDITEICNISERTFFRVIKKHNKKVGHIIDKYGHGTK